MDHSVSEALKPPEWMKRGREFALIPGQRGRGDIS